MDLKNIHNFIFNYEIKTKYSANLKLIYDLNDVNKYEKIMKNIKGEEEKLYMKT